MSTEIVVVPDLGGAEVVEVIEILVAVGDVITEEASLVTVESDKASMEVPSPKAGKILSISVTVGSKVSEGHALLELEVDENAEAVQVENPAIANTTPSAKPTLSITTPLTVSRVSVVGALPSGSSVYAGPAVRKFARELGVDLLRVPATGPRGRLQKDDLHNYIRSQLQLAQQGGSALPKIPDIDFTKFGEIELEPMSKIARVTAENMQRSWLNVPHVTQFDEVSLTELDALRSKLKSEGEKRGIKLTPMAFLLKAIASILKEQPKLNSSLHNDGKHFVRKKYVHIGMAVDTPVGLMVPVIRDVDKKDIWQIAQEVMELSSKARDGKLKPAEMQGGCFTISSLGAIGGTSFTPIVNAPELAILGVSKSQIKPVWNGKEFLPVNMLPLCLSYDHRAVNGADAGRFMVALIEKIEKVSFFISLNNIV